MKVDAREVADVLGLVKDVVGGSEVVEQLKAFHFFPLQEEGQLKIIGTDGSMTVVVKVPYVPTEQSDGSRISVSDDRVLEPFRFMEGLLEFTYDEETDQVEFEMEDGGKGVWKKHFSMDEEVDFGIDKETEFDDRIRVDALQLVLRSLSKVVDTGSPDAAAKTIFLNGEKAIVSTDTAICTVYVKTEQAYEIGVKAAKQMELLISGLEPDDEVQLKKLEGDRILFSSKRGVMDYVTADVMEPETEVLDEFHEVDSCLVGKDEFLRKLRLARTTSEEDRIEASFTESALLIRGYYDGEEIETKVEMKKRKSELENDVVFEVLASELLKVAEIVDNGGLVLQLDTEEQVLRVRDPEKKKRENSVESVIVVTVQ